MASSTSVGAGLEEGVFGACGTRLAPTWMSVDAASLRRTEALISPLKPSFSHSAIWASYSQRNFARRSCPQTSGDLTPMVPMEVSTRSISSIICSASGSWIGSSAFASHAVGPIRSPVPTQANPGITIAASRVARAANGTPADRRTSMKSSRRDRPTPTLIRIATVSWTGPARSRQRMLVDRRISGHRPRCHLPRSASPSEISGRSRVPRMRRDPAPLSDMQRSARVKRGIMRKIPPLSTSNLPVVGSRAALGRSADRPKHGDGQAGRRRLDFRGTPCFSAAIRRPTDCRRN